MMNKECLVPVMEIERFAIHDGPGIRTVVFMQGCPLHCPWCANPESQRIGLQLMHRPSICVKCGRCAAVCPQQAVAFAPGAFPLFDRQKCDGCGKCEERCPHDAIRIVGKTMTVGQIVDRVLRDKDYYDESGGGVTYSGGEVFTHVEELAEMLGRCRQRGIHTAIETSGMTSERNIKKVMPLTDLFLFDMKGSDGKRLKEVTGVDWGVVTRNLHILANANPDKIVMKMPCIPGFNLEEQHFRKVFSLACSLNIKRIDLLPYHNFGVSKYEELGREYPYVGYALSLDKSHLVAFQQLGESMGLDVRL